MKKILLHTGVPKTGSTSIQMFLAAHAEELQALRIRYPILREDPRIVRRTEVHHYPLLIALMGMVPAHFLVDLDVSNEIFEATFRDFFASDDEMLLFSHESFSMRNDIDFARFQRAAAPARLETVTYVRYYDEWLESRYSQRIRANPEIRLNQVKEWETGLLANSMLSRLQKLKSFLPKAKMHVRSFDRFRKRGLIADFLEVCEVESLSLEAAAPTFRVENQRLASAQLLFMAYVSSGLRTLRFNPVFERAGNEASAMPFADRSFGFMPQCAKLEARELHRKQLPQMREEFALEADEVPDLTAAELEYATSFSASEFKILLEYFRPYLDRPEDAQIIAGAYEVAAPLFQ